MALWFRFPGPDAVRMSASAVFALMACAAIVAQFGSHRVRALIVFAAIFAGLLAWWATITPPKKGNWAPDVARQVTGVIEGDILTLTDVREFEWRTAEEFTENWTTRSYNLSKLQTVDLFLSYWAGPEISHFILSFGFEGDRYLAWSVEVRREIGTVYSPVADMFKANSIAFIASAEEDVIGLRSNVRGEDVQLFRLRTPPDEARALLEEYVRDANRLAEKPHWYHSLTTNCTTVIFKMLDAMGTAPPLDWRIVLNGYLPDFGYERGVVNTDIPLSELRKLGRIAPRAHEAGLGPGFSSAIRVDVPVP